MSTAPQSRSHHLNELHEACKARGWSVGLATSEYTTLKGDVTSKIAAVEVYDRLHDYAGRRREKGGLIARLLATSDVEKTAEELLAKLVEQGLLL